MNKEEIERIIKYYLLNNLRIDITEKYGEITVKLILDDRVLSESSEILPTPKVSFGNY